MSRAYDDYMEQRRQKEESLLDVPERIAEAHAAIDDLAVRLEESRGRIVELKKKLDDVNSVKSKMKDYVIGGIIGAILGGIASALLK